MKKSCSVVIPNYNGCNLLEKNIPHLIAASQYKKNNIDEIIVVDDASKDESVKLLKEHFPQVFVIKHKKNRGFVSAVNTGVRMAKGDLVVLLNNDVKVKKNFLQAVFTHFDNKDIFAVSLHEQGYGWAKGKFANGFIVFQGQTADSKIHQTFWVNGGSGVFSRDKWIKLGGMDEDLFKFYWEDNDISYRAQKRGWVCIWEPKSKVVHKHESTISKVFSRKSIVRMQERNQLLFIWKNLTSAALMRKHIRGLIKRIVRNPGYSVVFLMALPKIRIVLKKRKKEKIECKVSDETIFAKFS